MEGEKVSIYTEKFMIVGEVAITRKGYRKRLSDFLNDKDIQFIPILRAKLSPVDMKRDITEAEVIILNKNEIIMVTPEKEIEL
ncbi:MAG: hypothetical protein HY578_01235 [Nitrospinae bacterium]|nr:hypothetical protein [Nitrospinota bacterium]